MKYMLLLFGGADWAETMTEDEIASGMATHGAFEAFLQGRGLPYSGEALVAPRESTTIRREGEIRDPPLARGRTAPGRAWAASP